MITTTILLIIKGIKGIMIVRDYYFYNYKLVTHMNTDKYKRLLRRICIFTGAHLVAAMTHKPGSPDQAC